MISINIYEIIFQMINFLVLLWLLKKFLLAPVSEMLKRRRETITSDLNEAKENKHSSEKLLEEQKDVLKQARLDAREIRQKTEDAIKHEREEMFKVAKKESAQIVEAAKKEADVQFKRVKKEVLDDISDVVITLTEKVLQKSVNRDEKQAILTQYLEKVKN